MVFPNDSIEQASHEEHDVEPDDPLNNSFMSEQADIIIFRQEEAKRVSFGILNAILLAFFFLSVYMANTFLFFKLYE